MERLESQKAATLGPLLHAARGRLRPLWSQLHMSAAETEAFAPGWPAPSESGPAPTEAGDAERLEEDLDAVEEEEQLTADQVEEAMPQLAERRSSAAAA